MTDPSTEREMPTQFTRRDLTLDMAGLTEEEREEGSILIDGFAAKYVRPGDEFDKKRVGTIVFEWGDPDAIQVFDEMSKVHPDFPDTFPFHASAVVGDNIWSLAVQHKDFNPDQAFLDRLQYSVVPYDRAMAPGETETFCESPTLRTTRLLGQVGCRWVLFGSRTNIR